MFARGKFLHLFTEIVPLALTSAERGLDAGLPQSTGCPVEVAERVVEDLPDGLKPNKKSRRAGGDSSWRYYRLWFSQSHWGARDMTYYVHLLQDMRLLGY